VQNVDQSTEYFVLFQGTNENKYAGIIKIVEKTKATVIEWNTIRVKAAPEDWQYYKRRS